MRMEPLKQSTVLIDELTENLKPIRPAWSPWVSSLMGTGIGLGFVLFCVGAILGTRASTGWGFSLTLLILVGLVTSASYVAFALSTPGHISNPRSHWLPDLFLVLFNVALAAHLLPVVPSLEEGITWGGFKCSATLIALAALPGLAFFLICRKRAPVDPKRTARAVGVAVAAAGAFGLALHCPSDHGSHLIVYHALPLFALEWALTYAGIYLLRW